MFKKVNAWLHLWLGISSGIIVVIVSITGCIYVFENEIRGLYEPWRFVKVQNKTFVKPSELLAAASPFLKDQKPTSIIYNPKGESSEVASYNRKEGSFINIYVNPYTANVLKVKSGSRRNSEFDFFRFILNGHRALWLPYPIGRPIVGVGVLIFVFLLISGLILWWPKKLNKSNINKSFKINWGAKFKRVNYDFHNVLGFYSMIFLLFISLTGLVWSFEWFSKSLYWVTTGGNTLVERNRLKSDTTNLSDFQTSNIDKVWFSLSKKPNEGMYITVPKKPADVLGATLYLRSGTYYKTDVYSFDQKTLKPLKSSGPFAGKYDQASIGDKLRRMNYDIHIGAILGIPGKIIAFLVSLISASLPITGFVIWWGKNKKSKRKTKNHKDERLKAISEEQLNIKHTPPIKRRNVAITQLNINKQ
ncbi:PepSY-associated TM helix domain-containing protein [Pedobacter alpinus]|uniref:PepSY-associated TM helix domain-containing protein n=1 Tax=Pedobacter alpinus TaxID=1590643 RepID=A0ABW5TTJ3_9SPHI